LAERTDVSVDSVHALIIGEHGDSEFPLWSQASIGPVPIGEWRLNGMEPLSRAELDEIAFEVKTAAYKVIEGKGATNFAIGLSGARIVQAVLRDEHAIMPVSSVLSDYMGIGGVALSVPTLVNAQGAARVIDLKITDEELAKLQASAATLRKSIEALGLA
jgi:L-lactate dehydrogenase